MLEAVGETARWTTEKILEIRKAFERTKAKCQAGLKGGAYSAELVEVLFRQPYCRIDVLVKNGIAKRQTASKYLQKLEAMKILKGRKVGRDKIYLNPELLDILTK